MSRRLGNYLYGAPFGPNKNRNEKGLGIPLDLSLAFHTDAGITRNDTAIGTLMIYTITGLDTQKVFPDGVSRLLIEIWVTLFKHKLLMI